MVGIIRMNQALGTVMHAQDVVHQRGMLMMEEQKKRFYEVRRGRVLISS